MNFGQALLTDPMFLGVHSRRRALLWCFWNGIGKQEKVTTRQDVTRHDKRPHGIGMATAELEIRP